jgi:hypothetical protein
MVIDFEINLCKKYTKITRIIQDDKIDQTIQKISDEILILSCVVK